jgi:hypothetical protein
MSSQQQQQPKPEWRHAGKAPPPKPPSPSMGVGSSPYKGPRAWHTREELVACVEETTRRAELVESERDGARMACEMLKEEVSRAEAKEHEALAAASAAKAYSLTVGENEVRLRMMLEEQGAQLATASREEASVREALREAQSKLLQANERLDAVDAQAAAATKRAEKADRAAREAREALAEARATQAEVDALRAALAEARQQAANLKAQVAEEANARRSLGIAAKESKQALAKLREEADAQKAQSDAVMARELALQRERLGALRHVNGALEGRLRALFNMRTDEKSKATTLQEAVQMLTDEYVVVVDQLRSTQEALAQEQRHLSRAAKQAMTWRSIVRPGASSWEADSEYFQRLPQFPSVDVRSGVAKRGQPAERAIVLAYRAFHSFSTNLVGVFDGRLRKPGAAEAPWPTMGCAGGIPGD